MTPELKERWIAALESGKYNHGRFVLGSVCTSEDPAKHCCLGVLAEECKDEIMAAGIDFEWDAIYLQVAGQVSLLRGKVRNLLQLDDNHQEELMKINDAKGRQDYKAQISYIKDNL